MPFPSHAALGSLDSRVLAANDPSCTRPNCDISHICQTVMAGPESKTPLERLSTLAGGPGRRRALRTVEEAETEEAQRRVEQPAVDSARGAERPTSPHATYDYWGYQTCTEFGFYQTCEVGSNCFFTQGLMTLDQFTPMCKTYARHTRRAARLRANPPAAPCRG